MRVGVIGLGKMGGQIVRRLEADGHTVVVYDKNADLVSTLVATGSTEATSLKELTHKLGQAPVVWLMIPSQYTGNVISARCKELPQGAIIIDGGNSDYRETIKRGNECQSHGISLVDIGVSGGIHGLKNGFSMMIGGDKTAVSITMPLVKSLGQPQGYAHFGPTGSGHYVKMVHNAIEYGMMQALAEGYHLLKKGEVKDIDLAKAGKVWEHGSVVRSWLNELCAEVFTENTDLDGIDGVVAESGEARWALESAKANGISMPVIQQAFDVRLASQQGRTNFSTKVLAAMRNKFGGHDINPKNS